MARRGDSEHGRTSRTSRTKQNDSNVEHQSSMPVSHNSSQTREGITFPEAQIKVPVGCSLGNYTF